MSSHAPQLSPQHRHLSLVEVKKPTPSSKFGALTLVADDAALPTTSAGSSNRPNTAPLGAPEISEPRTNFVQSLAVVVFEIIEGSRSIQQLGASVTLRAQRQVAGYRAARTEQRTVLGLTPNTVRHVGRVRIDRPSATVAEVATVVYTGKRARAVAVRLEWEHSRWRANDIAVL